MEAYRQRLSAHRVLGLDTSILIYHLEAHPVYQPLTQALLSGIESSRWAAVVSTVTLMELTVRPWKLGRPGVARAYEALLVHFPHLAVVDVTRDVARRAAQLRARFNVQPADALVVGTALVHEATALVTNDQRLARLEPVLDVVVLGDFVL